MRIKRGHAGKGDENGKDNDVTEGVEVEPRKPWDRSFKGGKK